MPSQQRMRAQRRCFATAAQTCLGVLFVLILIAGSANAAITVSGDVVSQVGFDRVGATSIGRVTIDGGTGNVTDQVIVGDQATAIGLVTVTDFNTTSGFASSWRINQQLTVANAGTGRWEIANGALTSVDFNANPGTGDLIVGNAAGSVGTVIVNGLGSMLRMGDDSFIGVDGSAVLHIENEGYVVATNDMPGGSDEFTVGSLGRVELTDGRLRTDALTNNGAIVGRGRVEAKSTIANTFTGRLEVAGGDRLVVSSDAPSGIGFDNDGEIAIVGGEMQFLQAVTNSDAAANVTLRNGGVVRFPKSDFGFESTAGVLATTQGTNDIYGTVRLEGSSSKIVVAGESTAVFHDPVTSDGGVIEVFPGSTPVYLQGLTIAGNSSALSLYLAEPQAKPDFGQVEVAGAAALAGTLQVQLASGYRPTAGASFQVVTYTSHTGEFADLVGDYLGEGLFLDPVYSDTSLTLIATQAAPGDTDLDGDVDLSDLGNLATSFNLSNASIDWINGDFDNDNDVDLNDLGTLATFFNGGKAQAYAEFEPLVPEPACTLIFATLLRVPRRRKR